MAQAPAHRTLPADPDFLPGARGCLLAPSGRCAGPSLFSALVLGVVGLGPSPATAQPVTHPEPTPCTVTFAYAPEAVRAEIEAWVRAEPRCVRQLELRVVPRDGGLYLVGRDSEGHVRERVVPDAEAAAVLVVSWIADDTIAPTPVAVAPASAPPEPPVAAVAPSLPPPALPRLGGDEIGLVQHAPRGERARSRRWLMLGGVASDGEVGARAQLELLVRGRWSLGVSGAWLTAPARGRDARMGGDTSRGRAVLSIARELTTLGPVSLRAQLGAGLEIGSGDAMTGTRLTPVGEAALLFTLPLGDTWGITGGPVVDVPASGDQPSVGVFLGLARRL